MAYDKKYPNINDDILAFDKGQEDRVEKEFKQMNDQINSKIIISTDASGQSLASQLDEKITEELGRVFVKWGSNNQAGSQGLWYGENAVQKFKNNFATPPIVTGWLEVSNTVVWAQLRYISKEEFAWLPISPFKYELNSMHGYLHYKAVGKI